jgi:hypothetical protein
MQRLLAAAGDVAKVICRRWLAFAVKRREHLETGGMSDTIYSTS